MSLLLGTYSTFIRIRSVLFIRAGQYIYREGMLVLDTTSNRKGSVLAFCNSKKYQPASRAQVDKLKLAIRISTWALGMFYWPTLAPLASLFQTCIEQIVSHGCSELSRQSLCAALLAFAVVGVAAPILAPGAGGGQKFRGLERRMWLEMKHVRI